MADVDSPLSGFRTRAGLTKSALARALGVSSTTVWAWEQGKAPVPVHRRPALAAAVGVSVEDVTAASESLDANRRSFVRETNKDAREMIIAMSGLSGGQLDAALSVLERIADLSFPYVRWEDDHRAYRVRDRAGKISDHARYIVRNLRADQGPSTA